MSTVFDQTSAAKTFPLAKVILAAAADGTMSVEEIQHTITGPTKRLEAEA